MPFGAALLCAAMWGQVPPWLMAAWVTLIVANQLWRGALVREWLRAQPGLAATPRWGRYWAVGSTTGGALWGIAAVAMYPDSPPHQALLIVCLFGVVLGGLNLTAVYKPSFYGFVVPALVPLILREALVADQVHTFTALVMTVVLGFVLAFGHHLNDVLTRSLAIRYENIDLINGLKARRVRRTKHAPPRRRPIAPRVSSSPRPATTCGSRCTRSACTRPCWRARARDAPWQPLVGNVQNALNALEAQFAQLLDLSQLEAGAHTAGALPCGAGAAVRARRGRVQAAGRQPKGWSCAASPRAWPSTATPRCSNA